GIPICTIAAFLGLLVTYRTINVISLAGVAFAIGMTLDNSIVVLENIHRHLDEGRSRLDAALAGVTEVWPAVLASTLTTMFVFLPVVFVQQEAGQLYSDIAVAISASIFVSMLIATLVVPAACGRLLVRSDGKQAAHGAALGRRYIGLAGRMLSGTPQRLGVIALTVGLAALIITTLVPDAEYLPEGEEKKIFARLIPPPGYNIGEMDKLIRNLQEEFIPYVDADADAYDRGEIPIPPIIAVTAYASPDFAMLIMETHEQRHIDDLLQITSEKVSGFPGLISFATRGSIFSSNFGGSRSINIDISAPDLQTLFETGLKIFIRSREVLEDPQIRPEPASLTMGQPMLEVYPDWERAAELGFDTADLGYLIWAFSDGAFVDEYYKGDEKIDMFLFSTQSRNADPTNLENLLVYSPNGGVVPLGAITNVRETVNTETIRRIDGVRTITLSVIPPRDVPLERGLEIVRGEILDKMRAAGEIDPSVTLRISGAGDQLDATRSALLGNFVLAVFISYLLLVAIFSHWGYPLIILTTVPIGISGGIVGLAILNAIGANLDIIGLAPIQQPFDMITMLGFLILIGTVVNNPILIVDKTLRNVRDNGMSNFDAVVDAARTRLRPIMMSSVTTVVGLSPLVFNPGAGTELYRGLGAIVLFGLLFSTLVTLTFLPALLMQVLETLDRFGWRMATPATGDSRPAA
ncbi:MAG: efflux RND transporter permease subunit, partial [Gammaproteobacteria bacterium]|nr:efflux RND transporter permease subunit [Gammaproteobacteria bacterium]NNL99906.1 efflux RND transporter permease subunit [Gammaproteobacteria bacterium]